MLHRLFALASLSLVVACGSSDGTSAPAPSGDPAPSQGTDGPAASTPATPAPAATTPAAPAPDGAPYPIVLLHGMAGFDTIDAVGLTYYSGVKDDLAKHGETQVFATTAPPYASSDVRAQALVPQILDILAKTNKAKVNLVGHSQGGMDARVLASPAGFGLGDKIASVTTVATPHRGSKVADLTLGLTQGIPQNVFDDVTGQFLSVIQKTIYDVNADPNLHAQLVELSEAHAKIFNQKYVDDPRVHYESYAGRTNYQTGIVDCASSKVPNDPTKVDAPSPMIQPMAVFLEEGHRVANDGLVTVGSARWGQFVQCVPADHLKEVHPLQDGPDPTSGYDHLAFFRGVVARIRAAGY